MEENWLAFYITIMINVTPEQAFELYQIGRIKNASINEDDVKSMIKLHKKYKYKEIAEMYGLTKTAVIERIRYYKKKYNIKNVKKKSLTSKGWYALDIQGNLHRQSDSKIMFKNKKEIVLYLTNYYSDRLEKAIIKKEKQGCYYYIPKMRDGTIGNIIIIIDEKRVAKYGYKEIINNNLNKV